MNQFHFCKNTLQKHFFFERLCDLFGLVNVSDSIWDKLTRVILALLVFAGVLGIVVWYAPVV